MTPAFLSPTLLTTVRKVHRSVQRAPSRPIFFPKINRRTLRYTVATAAETTEAPEATDTWVSASELSKSSPATWTTVQDAAAISKVLPHRYPFLLIDRVIAFEPGKRAIAIKNVSWNEPQFTGHFPGNPIMPGVLQVEALAQVGGIVMLQQPISDGKGDFFFGGVDKVKWRRPVVPGDTLVMEMSLESFKPRFGIAKMAGKAYVAGKLACEGMFTLVMVVDK